MRGRGRKTKGSIRHRGGIDTSLVILVLFLIFFGLIMILSASYYHSFRLYGNHIHFFMRQLIWSCLGIVAMFTVTYMPVKILNKLSGWAYLASIVALVLVMLIGTEINGSRRWLNIVGPIGFQPSEMAKVALLLFLSFMVTSMVKHVNRFKVLCLLLLMASVPIVLVAVEDLSTGLILAGMAGMMIFVVYRRWYHLVGGALFAGAGAFYIFVMQESYRMERVLSFAKQLMGQGVADPSGVDYQATQSLYAIGSGGWFGLGLGQSLQKIDFLPEAHNDIIFAIICEELGLFGALAVFMLFGALLYRILVIAIDSQDIQGKIIASAVMVQIGMQTLINIAVATNSIPTTGMPLPFISYGGSSLVFLMIEIGLVLNVSRNSYLEKTQEGASRG